MLLVYNSKETKHSCIDAAEWSVEEFEVYQNLVKADKFSLMPWQKNASQKGKPDEGLSFNKAWGKRKCILFLNWTDS